MEDYLVTKSDALGVYVRQRYQEAKEAKQDVYDTMLDCLRQVRGEQLSCDMDEEDDGIEVIMNITSPIVRGVVGLIRDVLANNMEAPFVVKPTPTPDLNEEEERRLINRMQRELPQLLAEAGGDEEVVLERVRAMRNAAKLYQDKAAARAATAMDTLVQDRLHDAGWLKQFGDFIYNFVVYPAAIMKAPVTTIKKWKQWTGLKMTVEEAEIRSVENISPFDFYPAPYSHSVDKAEYIIERRRIRRFEMVDLSGVPGYSAAGIKRVFEKYPHGHVEEYEGGREHAPDHDVEGETIPDVGYFDALGFYGLISGTYLKEFGVDIPNEESSYEAEVWVVGDVVIKAVLNPDPLGNRPFHVASFEPIPGSFWGECPVTRLRDPQRVCTATARNLIRNMGFASGPIGEVDMSRVDDDGDPRVIYPRSLRLVKPDRSGSNRNAYQFHNIPSLANELMAIFNAHLDLAYELIGIPRVAFGSPEGLGTIGRTSGGVAMILNQASKSIKFALRVLEEEIIEKVVQRFIDYELMYSDDPTIKGDIRVYARGVSGLVEQEEKQSRLEWALQSIVPLMQIMDPDTQRPIVPPVALLRLLYEIFKANGVPTEGILPDFDVQSAVDGGAPSVNPLFEGASFDGRNAQAAQAIADSNGLIGGPQL